VSIVAGAGVLIVIVARPAIAAGATFFAFLLAAVVPGAFDYLRRSATFLTFLHSRTIAVSFSLMALPSSALTRRPRGMRGRVSSLGIGRN
jgi:hypothetical protein